MTQIPTSIYAIDTSDQERLPGYNLAEVHALIMDPSLQPRCCDIVAVWGEGLSSPDLMVLEDEPPPIAILHDAQDSGVIVSTDEGELYVSYDQVAALHPAIGYYDEDETLVHPLPARVKQPEEDL